MCSWYLIAQSVHSPLVDIAATSVLKVGLLYSTVLPSANLSSLHDGEIFFNQGYEVHGILDGGGQ
jgi:hypothetical protein